MRGRGTAGGILFAAALLAAALLAGCGSSGPSSTGAGTGGSASAPVKVGYLLPLTGVFTKNGNSELDGWKLGLKTFGNSVDGHPIQMYYVNDEGSPAVSLTDARQLVTGDHVQVVEGPLVSSAIAAVAPYVLSQGLPEDDLYLASPQQQKEYTTTGMGMDSAWEGYQPSTVGAQWAYQTMGWRHVTTVGLGISFGWQGVGGFAAEFSALGGTIDKKIWVPSNAVDMSAYVSAIPPGTQAVWVVLSGQQAANFLNDYQSFGLKARIPLMGITTLTDQAALPATKTAAAIGVYTDSQYCDGSTASLNQQFANSFYADYGAYPSYYSEAGYTKAEILVAALKSLHGVVSSEKALAAAMRAVSIQAPRGPVTISPVTWSPVENEYICKVEMVAGHLRNVVLKTYPAVQPWGVLPQSTWQTIFAAQSVAPPG
jgi:branched-chain amino acid transport system substrate-binding protein